MSLLALKDLFARHRERATGLWRLGQEPCRTVFMEAGDIVFAASTYPLDRLTHLLVERGKITQAQLDYAMANLKPAISIGKNLIEMGFITQRDLLDVARSQVERLVWTSLAAPEEVPSFDAKDLDATAVRLSFDTAAMLLAGVLNLGDRERVLEELGPLNQVVVLEGRRHQELSLPADLAKLPNLLDGSRTLLELSRESGVEPFRLGAFVLFLREMGWARLHELPPLDRRALELALDPPESTISPSLPDPPRNSLPSLFEEIHASQAPTTNLEYLSESLDQLGPEDELDDPLLPDPEPEPPMPGDFSLPIHHEAEGSTEEADPPAPGPTLLSPAKLLLALLALLVLAGGVWGGLKGFRQPPATAQPVSTPALESVKPNPTPEPERKVEPEAPKATPAPTPAKPEPEPIASRSERLQTILQGHWKQAMAQGATRRTALQGRWTLRLEIACQGSTVQQAAEFLKAQNPDLFLIPIIMRDGRTCNQVFMGSFGSEDAAKAAAAKLPAPFLAEGNRPKPFRVAEIPDRQ